MQVPNNLPSPGGSPVRDHIPSLVGQSEPMQRLRKQIAAVACKDCTVLVNGESGTGKELVARSIHSHSDRSGGPFVAVDCTGLRDTLMESQLFGHNKGAFTGADQPTLGFIRAADGGVLFLDEIGELELKTQAKLLRCIQERCVVPLGATKPVPVDVRVVCATHRDLKSMVARGEFREDLYFRLDVVRLELPPLRDRRDDILRLAMHFLNLLSALYNEPARAISRDAIDVLEAYHWPGNVRELANAIEHAVVFSPEPTLGAADFPERIRSVATRQSIATIGEITESAHVAESLQVVTLEAAERTLIARALRATAGNQSHAARLLSIDRRRLYRKIKRYELVHLTVGGEED